MSRKVPLSSHNYDDHKEKWDEYVDHKLLSDEKLTHERINLKLQFFGVLMLVLGGLVIVLGMLLFLGWP